MDTTEKPVAKKNATLMISYSRKDKVFVKQLYDCFVENGFAPEDIWVDWEGIPLSADWMAEITKGIQSANAFIFVISPDSVLSDVCAKEIELAAESNKRFIPILHREPGKDTKIHEKISSHNWVFIRNDDEIAKALPNLIKAINTDLEWLAQHTRLFNRAKEWDSKGRNDSYLVRGKDLQDAEIFIGKGATGKEPSPTSLHVEYVTAARKFAASVRRRNRIIAAVVGIALLALSIFASFQAIRATNNEAIANEQRETAVAEKIRADNNAATAQANEEEAKWQAQISRANELASRAAALRTTNFRDSILLGIEAFNLLDSVQTRGALLDGANANPRLTKYLIEPNGGRLLNVAMSPDGKMLASGGELRQDSGTLVGIISLWDMATHQPIGEPLMVDGGPVYNSPVFSPDGKLLASSDGKGGVILWDIARREPIGEPLVINDGYINLLAFSPDGKILASDNNDNTIILWDVNTLKPLDDPLIGHNEPLSALVFSPNGKYLASTGSVSSISDLFLWDMRTHQVINKISERGGDASNMAINPDGQSFASVGWDNTVTISDLASFGVIKTLKLGELQNLNAYAGLAYSPDGSVLAVATIDNSIILLNTTTWEHIGQPLTGHYGIAGSLVFTPDGTTLVSGSSDGTAIIWDVDPNRRSTNPPLMGEHESGAQSVAFSPDGELLVSSGLNEDITLWDVMTGTPIKKLAWHSLRVPAVAFSPDGKTIASGSYDDTVAFWDVATGQPRWEPLEQHTDILRTVAYSPDGKLVASGGGDSTIILWDTKTGQMNGNPLEGASGWIMTLAFSMDGKLLASGDDSGQLIFWDVQTRKQIGDPLIYNNYTGVYSLAFSPDGKHLAAGMWEGSIVIWDVAERKITNELLKQHSNIVSVAYSPDGRILASGGYESNVILWDMTTFQPMGSPLKGQIGFVLGLAFSPDGKLLASASKDGSIVLWDTDYQTWIEKSCQRAGGNFTLVDWEKYFPGEEYHKTCK